MVFKRSPTPPSGDMFRADIRKQCKAAADIVRQIEARSKEPTSDQPESAVQKLCRELTMRARLIELSASNDPSRKTDTAYGGLQNMRIYRQICETMWETPNAKRASKHAPHVSTRTRVLAFLTGGRGVSNRLRTPLASPFEDWRLAVH